MAAEFDVHVKLCQQQITKIDLQIKAVIQDIQECLGPLSALEELNQIVSESISEYKKKLKDLEQYANEQDKETSRLALMKEVSEYKALLSSSQMSLRKANLRSQLEIERREKDELLAGDSGVRKRPKSSKEALAATSSNITDNLMKLSRMMANQVKQSEETMGTLITSSAQVGDTREEFKNMSGHIQSSRKLLTKYGRRECTDRILIFFALVFFFACVLYIIKKRLVSSSDDYETIQPEHSQPVPL